MNIICDSGTEDDNFKKKFKYYKSNKPKPSFCELLSVDDTNYTDKFVNFTPIVVKEDARSHFLGLEDTSEWKCYSFFNHPGLVLIRNPFTKTGQRYWIKKCLEEYPKKPNKINIDIEMCLEDWWMECYQDGECNRRLQKKLRWTTLGFHHNWDTKLYSNENRSSFPEDLAELCDVVAQYLGYEDFKAEAAIVNYYHMDSTLSPHTDHSEVNLKAPLFSFSFGQSAVFLIGGKNKSINPSAILLNSGDIVVMSQEARLCYHAVPRILPSLASPWNDETNESITPKTINLKYITNPNEIVFVMNKNLNNEQWAKFSSYVEESRINMNVRQVLNENPNCVSNSNFY